MSGPDRTGATPGRTPQSAAGPPRLARALLHRLGPRDIRDWLLEDLSHRFLDLENRLGTARARRWYWRQTLHGIIPAPRSPRKLLMHLAALIGSLAQDVRFSLRQLILRSPLPTLIAVATLAIGIGSSTVVVGAIDSVLLRPLPFAEADRLAMIWRDTARGETTWISAAEYLDYREQLADLADLATFTDVPRTLSGGAEPTRVAAAAVSANYFRVLGVEAVAGRTFAADEDGPDAPAVVLVTEGLFERYFGADPGAVGGPIIVNGTEATLIGVIPAGVRLPIDYREEAATELYLPQPYDRSNAPQRGDRSFHAAMRLREGVSLTTARRALDALHDNWQAEGLLGNDYSPPGLVGMREFLFGEVRPMLLILLAAAGFVLAIACANVAALLLARGAARRREIGVRVALGAQRRRVVRQVLAESLTLAMIGGALGLAVAAAGVRFVVQWGPAYVPRLSELTLDAGTLTIALGVSLATGLLFGFLPALHAARSEARDLIAESSQGQTAGRGSARRGLLIGELALAVMLAVAAVLLIRSFTNLRAIDTGFRADSALTLRVELPRSAYPDDAARERFWVESLERIRAIPGVVAAGGARRLPLASRMGDWSITVEGRDAAPGENPNGDFQVVTAGYFEAMGIEMTGGRALRDSDSADAMPVVVVSEAMARTYWPDGDALGKRFRIGSEQTPWYTIVGLFRAPKHNTLLEADRTEMVHTSSQFALAASVPSGLSLVIRTLGDPRASLTPVREAIRQLDAGLPVAEVRTLDEVVAAASADTRFAMALLSAFGAVALALAAAGIYGVVSYTVRQQTREIGIRMAIGLGKSQVVWQLVRASGRALALGVGAGLLGAMVLGRALQSLLIGVSPLDPLTLAGVSALVIAVTLLATLVPARRAARIDPVIALRGE